MAEKDTKISVSQSFLYGEGHGRIRLPPVIGGLKPMGNQLGILLPGKCCH